MIKSLRHIIPSLSALCLMAACNSPESEGPTARGAMEFDVASLSRSLTSSQNIFEKPFAVFSDMRRIDPTDESEYIPIHNATSVYFDTYVNQWKYDDTRYWFPGYQYSFVAYHPAGHQQVSGFKYEKNRLKFTYYQPSDYKDAPDLLISAHRRNYEGGKTDPVGFTFVHLLTKINLQVSYRASSSGPSLIKINSLTFDDIPVRSSYAIEPAPLTGNSTMTSDWVNDEESQMGWTVLGTGTLRIKFTGNNLRSIPANKGPFPLFSDSDPLLILPNPGNQDFPAYLTLNYTTDTGETEDVSATIPRGWDPATSLTLSLEIENGQVQFNISVEDWKEGTTTNTIVPRK